MYTEVLLLQTHSFTHNNREDLLGSVSQINEWTPFACYFGRLTEMLQSIKYEFIERKV